MLLTTSRKPAMPSRRLAKALCAFLPECVYANRGKDSFAAVCSRAYSAGQELVCVIHEKHGSPSMLSLARVVPRREGLDFEHEPEAVAIKSVAFMPELKQALSARRHPPVFGGEAAGKVMQVFGIDPDSVSEQGQSPFAVSCGNSSISFSFNGSKCMEIAYHISRPASPGQA